MTGRRLDEVIGDNALSIPFGTVFQDRHGRELIRMLPVLGESPEQNDKESVGMQDPNDRGNWAYYGTDELFEVHEEVYGVSATDYDLEHMRALANHTEAVSSGGSSSYYVCEVKHVTTPQNKPYFAECNDIIVALKMKFGQGNIFKAIWRYCAEQNLGKVKANNESIRDLDKIIFFAEQEKRRLQAEIDAAKA